MLFRFMPSGATVATTVAAVTMAALTTASPGLAQAPGAEEAAPPQAGPDVMPPAGSATSSGQAPPAAAEPAPPPSGPAAPPPPQHVTRSHPPGTAVTAARVNLRRGPGTDSELVTTIPAGAMVRVGECDGEWCAVTWNGQSGFAIARNLNLGPSRQAGGYSPPGQPGYPPGAYGPGVYAPPGPGYYRPPMVYRPAYYYGPRVYYYGGPWGWRRYSW
jgi:hypothetical protein